MLRVMAFACQFTVARTLGHNCSYQADEAQSAYTKKDWVAQETPCSHLLESSRQRKTIAQPSSEEQEILSVVQGRMGCE
jgi:hypothetical protein